MVLLIGGSKSGKSYTLRGNESKEKGIIINTLDDILNLIETSAYLYLGFHAQIMYWNLQLVIFTNISPYKIF